MCASTRSTTRQPSNPGPPASPFVPGHTAATPAVHKGFLLVAQRALLSALARPRLPNPRQLFQIVSIFLRAATASHPAHSRSVDDPYPPLFLGMTSTHSSRGNPLPTRPAFFHQESRLSCGHLCPQHNIQGRMETTVITQCQLLPMHLTGLKRAHLSGVKYMDVLCMPTGIMQILLAIQSSLAELMSKHISVSDVDEVI